MWLGWEQWRSVGHQGAGGGIPLQQLAVTNGILRVPMTVLYARHSATPEGAGPFPHVPVISGFPCATLCHLIPFVFLLLFNMLNSVFCQGASETGNVSRPSAHGAPTDLRNRHSRGWVPAEYLEQKMLYVYAAVCTQKGDFYLEQKMRRKLSSHFAQVLLYITNG